MIDWDLLSDLGYLIASIFLGLFVISLSVSIPGYYVGYYYPVIVSDILCAISVISFLIANIIEHW